MKNLQWTDFELLDRGIESYPELVITDEIMMDMLPNGSLTGIGVKQHVAETKILVQVQYSCRPSHGHIG